MVNQDEVVLAERLIKTGRKQQAVLAVALLLETLDEHNVPATVKLTRRFKIKRETVITYANLCQRFA